SHSDAGGEKHDIIKEIFMFIFVVVVGLLIYVAAFYCATQIIHPQFGISTKIWTELSIIFAALVVAIWNFLGYKFLVFKK
ncbi:MAG: GtrA family protein, partial [Candidatus Staskawiczbacteria bacterium]|nr:GtrA family protein [Candidatus Staskawiczbacteria bacterium]